MSQWRHTLIPGLSAPEVQDVLVSLVDPVEPVDASATVDLLSGVSATVLTHPMEGPWRTDALIALSAACGGWIAAAEHNSLASTWGLLLAHAGRTVLLRRQAQEPGTESDLGSEFEDVWGALGSDLLGEPSASVVRQCDAPLQIVWRECDGSDEPSEQWWILSDTSEVDVDPWPDVRYSTRAVADPLRSSESGLAVVHGVGAEPPTALLTAVRETCPDAVLLSREPLPGEAADLARRIGTQPGAFVAPSPITS